MRKCNFTYVQYVGELRHSLRWFGRNKGSGHHQILLYPHRTITVKRTDRHTFTTLTKGRFAAQSFAIELCDNFSVNIQCTEFLSKIGHTQKYGLISFTPFITEALHRTSFFSAILIVYIYTYIGI